MERMTLDELIAWAEENAEFYFKRPDITEKAIGRTYQGVAAHIRSNRPALEADRPVLRFKIIQAPDSVFHCPQLLSKNLSPLLLGLQPLRAVLRSFIEDSENDARRFSESLGLTAEFVEDCPDCGGDGKKKFNSKLGLWMPECPTCEGKGTGPMTNLYLRIKSERYEVDCGDNCKRDDCIGCMYFDISTHTVRLEGLVDVNHPDLQGTTFGLFISENRLDYAAEYIVSAHKSGNLSKDMYQSADNPDGLREIEVTK